MAGKTSTSAWGRQSSEDVGFWSYPAPPIRTVKRGLAVEVKSYSLFQGRAIRLREKGACAFYLALCIYLHKLASLQPFSQSPPDEIRMPHQTKGTGLPASFGAVRPSRRATSLHASRSVRPRRKPLRALRGKRETSRERHTKGS